MLRHADRYSPAFSLNGTSGKYHKVSYADYEAGNYPKEDEWKYSSFWYKDFQAMAFKTMIRQLISKWGVMSVDMQKAYDTDTKQMGEETNPTEYTAADAADDFFGSAVEAETVENPPEAEKGKKGTKAKADDII